MNSSKTSCDVLVIGAGAAGLFATLWAGRTARQANCHASIIALDGARKLGAKILIAGGGRCNVTHDEVTEADFAGSTPLAIRKVLRQFSVADTLDFFRQIGVELKREDTGKLFPVSDSARTVLNALVDEVKKNGAVIRCPANVTRLEKNGTVFTVTTPSETFTAHHVILCTGGKSLPKSGSDGRGYELAQRLGHSLSEPIIPALVPLLLPDGHWITHLSGLTVATEVKLLASSGKQLTACRGSTLCTHTGLSGPSILDISRHFLMAKSVDPSVSLVINWLPEKQPENLHQELIDLQSRGVQSFLRRHVPARLAQALCAQAEAPCTGDLSREARKRLVRILTATPLDIVGDRGFSVAEATAGGIPLSEVTLHTMESRIVPGLFFAGEMLDVDGRIGGFNFQWAWSSGFVAGCHAVQAVLQRFNDTHQQD